MLSGVAVSIANSGSKPMILARAVIRHIKGSFAEGSVFLLASERSEIERELRLLVFLAESRNRIVVLCPDKTLQGASALARYRTAIERQFSEPNRATITSSGKFLGYAIPAEAYRRSVRSRHDDEAAHDSRPGPRMGLGAALSSNQHDHFDAALWQSDRACLEQTLDDERRYSRGKRLHGLFRYREARRYLLDVSSGFGGIDDCRLLIADTYRREGRFAQEAAIYEKMAPAKSTSLLHAISLARSGRYADASDVLYWAPETDANTHYYRALCAEAVSDFEAAARHAGEATRLAPASAEAAYCRLVYLRRNREYLKLPGALVSFWRASSATAAEPLDLIDLPNAQPWARLAQSEPARSLNSTADNDVTKRCAATKEMFA
jgi:tetratricopeptide (TPR) repeat protein